MENVLKRRTGEIREWLPKRWRVSAPFGGGDAAAQSACLALATRLYVELTALATGLAPRVVLLPVRWLGG